MKVGSYYLGQHVKKASGLKKLTPEQRTRYDEKYKTLFSDTSCELYLGNDVSYLGYTWNVILDCKNGRICSISLADFCATKDEADQVFTKAHDSLLRIYGDNTYYTDKEGLSTWDGNEVTTVLSQTRGTLKEYLVGICIYLGLNPRPLVNRRAIHNLIVYFFAMALFVGFGMVGLVHFQFGIYFVLSLLAWEEYRKEKDTEIARYLTLNSIAIVLNEFRKISYGKEAWGFAGFILGVLFFAYFILCYMTRDKMRRVKFMHS